MAPGLPDRVDCAQLSENAVMLERVYPLGEMPRLRDVLADARGSVRARFAFEKLGAGRTGATVEIEATPHLLCQRCLQEFAFAAAGKSEIEFAGNSDEVAADSLREIYVMEDGRVSLRELAEEELLLALPAVAMHTPQTCARAPADAAGGEVQDTLSDRTRPFSALQDLLKKT
jgi:uncharacterized protein